ncbi:MAG: ABC transporter permease [Bacteroidota bacterium]
MIRNFLLLTWRNAVRQRGHTLINLLGLSIGLATCLVIFLYVQDEWSYDRFHPDADRLYRLQVQFSEADGDSHWAATQGHMMAWLKDRFPEITNGFRILPVRDVPTLRYGDKQFREPGFMFADSTFFELTGYEWLKGDKATALDAPSQLVLTASTAKKYFGTENPIGQTLRTEKDNYQITGVVADPPRQSHIQFDMVAPLAHLRQFWPGVDRPGPSAMYSYLQLRDPADLPGLQQKLERDAWGLYGADLSADTLQTPPGLSLNLFFNPMTEIRLNGNAEKELTPNTEWQYLYIFITIALFVLLIACINYMNLATARSMRRAREVGLRKVLGSSQGQLRRQFLGESILFVSVAMGLALFLTHVFLPVVNDLTGKGLQLDFTQNIWLIGVLTGITVFVGLVAGLYPAIFLARFEPIRALKSGSKGGSATQGGAVNLRRGLVVLQFAISVFLIVGAMGIYRQLQFMQQKELGFDKEQVLVANIPNQKLKQKGEALRQRLLSIPQVSSATTSSGIPGERVHILSVRLPHLAAEADESGQASDGSTHMRVISADADYVKTMGLEIVAGRDLGPEPNDERQGFLVNEAAVKAFGLDDPIGSPFEYVYGLDTPKVGTIVGVMKDFHYASLHSEVEPLMMHIFPYHSIYLSLRVSGQDMPGNLAAIETAWTEVMPELPFNYFFLDENYEKLYKSELTLGTLFTYFTGLALLIACLGLLGLASFVAQQRTREIGIRKVLGATGRQIVWMLSRQFTALVLVACLPGLLAAWWVMNWWMDGFAYRAGLGAGVFIMAVIAVMGLAWATVSWQGWKAARTNPVEALKDE